MSEDFYKKQTFELILEKIEGLERKVDSQGLSIDKVNQKFMYLYGIVTATSFVFSIVVSWVKGKFFS